MLAAPTVATAPVPAVPAVTPALAVAAAVELFYQTHRIDPIWFRGGVSGEAAKLLPAVLKRAPIDGLAEGAELAGKVEAALARRQIAAADPAAVLTDDKLLSTAWVLYVRALKAPIPGLIYGDPALAPKVLTPKAVLAEAYRAPSLPQHVQAVAAVNPIYAQLREAAWAASQAGAAPPDPRLIANLERARVLPASGRFLLVNTATAQLSMVSNGKVEDQMKVIVGKRGTQTPMLAGTIHYITLTPYWNIPADVARRSVAPLVIKRGTGYLRGARYEVVADTSHRASVVDPASVDWKAVVAGTSDVHIRQLPGANNMMGAVKFGFVNDQGIYLHDTPNKGLFAKAKRNFSLGCVRVEDAKRLARWMFGGEPLGKSDLPDEHVPLPGGMPVFITYLTAEVAGGQLSFADDVYGLDPKAALAEVKLATAPASTAESPSR